MKRLTALLLCITLAAALAGCGGAPAGTTVPPTASESASQAAEDYAEAAAKLDAVPNLELDVTCIEEMTLGADVFKTTTRQTVTLLGLGTDALAARVEGTCYSGSYYTETTETYLDGMFYSQINYNCFKAELTAEDYLDRLLPPVLVDESLYGSVEQTTASEFTFTDATGLESWCGSPYATLDTVTATARLDDNGIPNRFTYKAAYAQGAADMNLSVTIQVKEADADAAVAAPDRADSYTLLDTPEGPELIHLASGYLTQSTAITSTGTDVFVSQAGGCTDTNMVTMNAYGEDATQIANFTTVTSFTDASSNTTESHQLTEVFLDGVLTTVYDNGTPEENASLTGFDIRSVVENEVLYLIPDIASIVDYDMTIIGDTLLLEYTLAEENGQEYADSLCEYYFGNPDILNDMASAFSVCENGGYIGIDLTTGIPLSLSQTFTCTHTVSGTDYVMSHICQQNLQLGSLGAYEAITGEALPVEEPEEKASPLFYHVTGENGEEMWLLGTIHVGDARTAFLPQEIYDAFAASDALAVEFETERYTAQLMEDTEALQTYISAFLYTDGTTAQDHIKDAELYENTVKLMKATGTYDTTMQVTKPIFLYQTLQSYFMSNGYRLSSDYGVDHQLEQLAYAQEKEILSVESGEFQMNLLGNLSDGLQELMLREVIEYGQFAYNYGTQELFELWCTGDEAALTAYINADDTSGLTEEEQALYEEYNKALGESRNSDMLEIAKGYLSGDKTVFYAVGLAHLLAEDGLVNTLRDAGYTVELVGYTG